MCVATTGTMQLWMEPSSLADVQQKPSLLTPCKKQRLRERQPRLSLKLLTKLSWHKPRSTAAQGRIHVFASVSAHVYVYLFRVLLA